MALMDFTKHFRTLTVRNKLDDARMRSRMGFDAIEFVASPIETRGFPCASLVIPCTSSFDALVTFSEPSLMTDLYRQTSYITTSFAVRVRPREDKAANWDHFAPHDADPSSTAYRVTQLWEEPPTAPIILEVEKQLERMLNTLARDVQFMLVTEEGLEGRDLKPRAQHLMNVIATDMSRKLSKDRLVAKAMSDKLSQRVVSKAPPAREYKQGEGEW